jgi:GGDEF domain-containing protein
VISIKQFLGSQSQSPGAAGPEKALMHVIRILIEGIGEYAVGGEAEDCALFRESIRKISEILAGDIAAEDLLVHAGAVLKSLEEHNRRAAWHQRFQTTELQSMVKMLTSTVGSISARGRVNVNVLSDIERRVAVVSDLDDVRTMKSRLSDCLAEIRKETKRQQVETEETIQELRRGLERHQITPATAQSRGLDAITGLPLRGDAEAALTESGLSGTRSFAVVMVLDTLQMLNERFGSGAGDEILIAFTRKVQEYLNPGDQLFRWGGPALLALLARPVSFENVRNEVAHVMDDRMEHTIRTSSRSILIPIAPRWCLLPMMTTSRRLFQKIDDFAASPVVRT